MKPNGQHIPGQLSESLGIFRTITLFPVKLKLHEKVIVWHMQNDLNIAQDCNKNSAQEGLLQSTS